MKSISGVKGAVNKTYLSGVNYAEHGAVEEMTYGGASARKQRYCYNNRMQMTGLIVGAGVLADCSGASTTLMRLYLTYGASNNGNLETQDIAGDGFLVRQSYTYDKLNRLATAVENTLPTAGASGWKQTYGYDRWGNRWVDDIPANTFGMTLTGVPNNASWFNAKNRMNQQVSHDSGGNVTVANGFTLSYDAENRLSSAVHGTNASRNQVYGYDGDGRRVRQVSGSGGNTLTTHYVYDVAGELAAEYESVAGTFPQSGAQCETCFFAHDHLGSTRAVWDESGLKSRLDYLPYGEVVATDRNGRGAIACAAGVANCYNGPGGISQKFTGKERDAETGLDYFGARYMSAAQGRFTSSDPLLASARYRRYSAKLS